MYRFSFKHIQDVQDRNESSDELRNNKVHMKVLSIVGHSKAGKTTLITRLIPILKDCGLKILVVKHALDFEIDREGKDSWRIFNAGVDVAVASKDRFAFISRLGDNLDEICSIFNFYDLIITEGFNRACKDRIVVLREPDELENFRCGRILAVVCDKDIEGFRTLRFDQVDEIAKIILDWFYEEL